MANEANGANDGNISKDPLMLLWNEWDQIRSF